MHSSWTRKFKRHKGRWSRWDQSRARKLMLIPAYYLLPWTPISLCQARAAHSTAEKEELRIRGELETQEARLKQLYQKQGRSQSFATQKDRDVFLRQEVSPPCRII